MLIGVSTRDPPRISRVRTELRSFGRGRGSTGYSLPGFGLAVIGGGAGSFSLLSGLRGHEGLRLRSIVTMMDSGGKLQVQV